MCSIPFTVILLLYLLQILFTSATTGLVNGKYKVCVVDGRGGFKKAPKYCPILDRNPNSKVECVIGLDRLDCLRKISKGSADWSLFTPEDLVTALNSQVEMLITNEMRFTNDKYEYEVAAVISNSAGISSRHDLKNKKLCHPGYGYETDWTKILANYLESSVIPQNCDSSLTLMENKIKGSSDFFKAACKAGPWVNDPVVDRKLKRKYSNLCELCGDPNECSTKDKYWGRRGPLFCLTDGVGDVAWARVDDIRAHFDLTNTSSKSYSFLCPDGTILPLSGTNTCTWVVKPWPVVATRRSVAEEIQQLVSTLSHYGDGVSSWQSTLLDLIETYHIDIVEVKPVEAIESYLDRAPGYLSANSFAGCHPPRHVRICTTSNVENAKCAWLREAAAVYGVEPPVDCLKADNKTHCMAAVEGGKVDLVVVSPDELHLAQSVYNLKPLFHETVVSETDKYLTVAVVNKKMLSKPVQHLHFDDLKGLKSCFPTYDGVAFNTVVNLIGNVTNDEDYCSGSDLGVLGDFFKHSCIPKISKNNSNNNKSKHFENVNRNCPDFSLEGGDFDALRCLTGGYGDVAFVSWNSYDRFFNDLRETKKIKYEKNNFEILCDDRIYKEDEDEKRKINLFNNNNNNSKRAMMNLCHLSWAPLGHAMVRSDSSDVWLKDTLDTFLQMDNLFGKSHRSLTNTVTMFGLFDGIPNVLFHDNTQALRQKPTAKDTDTMPRFYTGTIGAKNHKKVQCVFSNSTSMQTSLILLSLLVFLTSFVYKY